MDLLIQNKQGNTPLHIAIDGLIQNPARSNEIIDILNRYILNSDVSIAFNLLTIQNNKGQTILDLFGQLPDSNIKKKDWIKLWTTLSDLEKIAIENEQNNGSKLM